MTLVLGPAARASSAVGTRPSAGLRRLGRIKTVTMKTMRALARFAFDLLTAPF